MKKLNSYCVKFTRTFKGTKKNTIPCSIVVGANSIQEVLDSLQRDTVEDCELVVEEVIHVEEFYVAYQV